jgi:hypothetical protein
MYSLVFQQPGQDNQPIVCPTLLGSPTIAIELEDLRLYSEKLVRAGYVQAVSTSNIGEVLGRSQLVIFGRTELSLDVPAYPYKIRFTPMKWVYFWRLTLFEKDRAGPSGIPTVPLVPETGKYQRVLIYQPSILADEILPARPGRTRATLYNSGTAEIYIGFDSSVSASTAIEILRPGGQWESVEGYSGPIWFSASNLGPDVRLAEFSQLPFN